MTKNILITGGAGFIGSHLCDELVKKGHHITVYDNLEPQVHQKIPDYLNKHISFVCGDVSNKEQLYQAISNTDVIFHEAAMVGVGQSMYQVERYVNVNTMGTAKLLDLLVNKDHNVKKLIVASSMSIYGEGAYKCEDCGIVYPTLRSEKQLMAGEWEMKYPNCNKIVLPVPTNESKPLQPTSIYAVSKKDQEEMSLAVGRAYGIPTVALRYFNVYGPRQSLNNPYTGVCAIFSSRIKNNNPPFIYEDGKQTRDFVSVHDIVQANVLCMEKSNANYNVFNVGANTKVSILEISQTLSRLYKKKIAPKIVMKYRSGDIRHCFADISKISKSLKYKPSVVLKEGMKELVDWGETQYAEDKSDIALKELQKRGLVEE